MTYWPLIFGIISFLASATYFGFFIRFHFVRTGYNPVSKAVSDYGVGKTARWFRIYLWISSLAAFAFADTLGFINLPGVTNTILLILMALGLARFSLSLFPTNLEGHKKTRTGILHYIFAIITFALVYIAISQLTTILSSIQPWESVSWFLALLKELLSISLIAVVVTLAVPAFRKFFGMYERFFLASENLWFILATALLVGKLW